MITKTELEKYFMLTDKIEERANEIAKLYLDTKEYSYGTQKYFVNYIDTKFVLCENEYKYTDQFKFPVKYLIMTDKEIVIDIKEEMEKQRQLRIKLANEQQRKTIQDLERRKQEEFEYYLKLKKKYENTD